MLERLFVTFLCIAGLIALVAGINFIANEWEFSKVPMEMVECRLMNTDYLPSTLRTHAAPVFGSDGKYSTAVYSTGHSEKYTTIWDCGIYGRVVCDKKEVFRCAKDVSTLYIRANEYDIRIVGIKK